MPGPPAPFVPQEWHGKPIVLANGRLQIMYWAADMRSGAQS